MSIVAEFLARVITIHKTQKATEHSYRPALKILFDALAPADVTATSGRDLSSKVPSL